MQDFQDRMYSLIEEMKSSTSIRINQLNFEKSEIEESDINFIIAEIENAIGIELDNYFKDYLFLPQEIWLSWDYSIGSDYIRGGEFRLINLFDVFVQNRPKLWHDGMSKDEIDFLKTFRPFEDHPLSGDGKLGALRNSDTKDDIEIWFYDFSSGYYKLSLNYEEYIESLFETRGFFGWQYLFVEDINDTFFGEILEALTNMINNLSHVFPDFKRQKYMDMIFYQKEKNSRFN